MTDLAMTSAAITWLVSFILAAAGVVGVLEAFDRMDARARARAIFIQLRLQSIARATPRYRVLRRG